MAVVRNWVRQGLNIACYSPVICFLYLAISLDAARFAVAAERPSTNEVRFADESERQAARVSAVALNYSRASLYRIRQNPTVRVMQEEQEKILNQLDLNGIADEEVVKLYSSVLDELAHMQLSDQERKSVADRYRRQVNREVSLSALTVAAHVATAQVGNAVKTGATSWWDYRTAAQNKDVDLFRIEKQRMTGVVEKSTQFLDTSWRMARIRKIPDRWLVRNDDLARLDDAWKQTDPAVRLRVLKRMEPYMECYPPFWYYLARTQQQLGQMFAAAETYLQLSELGRGHFRKDEMLATALANRAAIQVYLGQQGAADTALAALEFSPDAWEANLLCAQVLQHERQTALAEDAILRNIDTGLETQSSQLALLGLYYQSNDHEKLAKLVRRPDVMRDAPLPALVLAASRLRDEQALEMISDQIGNTISIAPHLKLGPDHLTVTAAPSWQLPYAKVVLEIGDRSITHGRYSATREMTQVTFEGVQKAASPLANTTLDEQEVRLVLTYPEYAPIRLTLRKRVEPAIRPLDSVNSLLVSRRPQIYRVTACSYQDRQLSLRGEGKFVRPGSPERSAIAPPDLQSVERTNDSADVLEMPTVQIPDSTSSFRTNLD